MYNNDVVLISGLPGLHVTSFLLSRTNTLTRTKLIFGGLEFAYLRGLFVYLFVCLFVCNFVMCLMSPLEQNTLVKSVCHYYVHSDNYCTFCRQVLCVRNVKRPLKLSGRYVI